MSFTIKNSGSANLTGLAPSIDGANATDFTVITNPVASLAAGGSTTLAIRFAPVVTGTRTATLHVTNNVAGASPFNINLTGQLLSYATDADGDGLNDAQEFDLAALGFDWQKGGPAQVALVNTYLTTANGAGLYTSNQVQALNIGFPLLVKNPANGLFTLTIGVQKATNLSLPFADFSMAGGSTLIDAQGKLEFQFSAPDNAQFYRLTAR